MLICDESDDEENDVPEPSAGLEPSEVVTPPYVASELVKPIEGAEAVGNRSRASVLQEFFSAHKAIAGAATTIHGTKKLMVPTDDDSLVTVEDLRTQMEDELQISGTGQKRSSEAPPPAPESEAVPARHTCKKPRVTPAAANEARNLLSVMHAGSLKV